MLPVWRDPAPGAPWPNEESIGYRELWEIYTEARNPQAPLRIKRAPRYLAGSDAAGNRSRERAKRAWKSLIFLGLIVWRVAR